MGKRGSQRKKWILSPESHFVTNQTCPKWLDFNNLALKKKVQFQLRVENLSLPCQDVATLIVAEFEIRTQGVFAVGIKSSKNFQEQIPNNLRPCKGRE